MSFDMRWNKRSSSNRYESLLRHIRMIGCKSKKIIAGIILGKTCRIYSCTEVHDEEPPDHVYRKNYEGLYKAMDVDAILHLYKEIICLH